MAISDQEQRHHETFVDRHRGCNEKLLEIGKSVPLFQTRMGRCPEKSASDGQNIVLN